MNKSRSSHPEDHRFRCQNRRGSTSGFLPFDSEPRAGQRRKQEGESNGGVRCSSSSLIELVSGEGTEGKRRGHWQAGGGNGEALGTERGGKGEGRVLVVVGMGRGGFGELRAPCGGE